MSKLSNFLTETGKATFKLGGAQTMKICVPVGSTFRYGNTGDKIEMEEIPLSVGLSQQFSFPSPFGNTPGIVEVFIKICDRWVKFIPINTGSYSAGITASCPGDGYVHVTTGNRYVGFASSDGTGNVSELLDCSSNAPKSAEVAFLVYAASSKTPDDYQAEETVIGTYFGKTLYRYCLRFNINVSSVNHVWVDLPPGIVEVVGYHGLIVPTVSNNTLPLNAYQTASNYALTNTNANNSQLAVSVYGNYMNAKCRITLEYIKEAID